MKHCLVIGGSSDIGAAVVRALVRQEHEVLWTYCHGKPPKIPGVPFQLDLTKSAMIRRLFNTVGSDALDLLVTAAFPVIECGNFDYESFRKVKKLLDGHVCALTLAQRCMRPGGKIINMLGPCVNNGLPGAPFYSAAFAFLHNWGKSINAVEGRTGGVRVCNFLLGPVETRTWKKVSPEVEARYRRKVQKFIASEQVAEVVAFLANQEVLPNEYPLDAYYSL